MLNTYYYKLYDEWTPPLEYLPRWLSANGYGDLNTPIAPPPTRTWPTPELVVSIPSATGLPANWVLTSSTSQTSGSLLQKIFQNLTYQKNFLGIALNTIYRNFTLGFDLSELSYAWFIDYTPSFNKLEVYYGATKVELKRALGFKDLFDSGDPAYLHYNGKIILAGLDIVESSTQLVSGWQFFQNENRFNTNEIVFFRHPVAGNFIAVHPSNTRSDGLLGFYGGPASKARIRQGPLKELKSITVYIDDTPITAVQDSLWTGIDEKALWFNLTRRPFEKNSVFAEVLRDLAVHAGQTYVNLSLTIGFRLRAATGLEYFANTLDAVVPSGAVFSVHNLPPSEYLGEELIPGPTRLSYYTIYPSGSLGALFINGRNYSFSVSGSLILPEGQFDSRVDQAIMFWRLTNYTRSTTGITFPADLLLDQNIKVAYTEKVKAQVPSQSSIRESFQKEQALKWQFTKLDSNIQVGLAVFE